MATQLTRDSLLDFQKQFGRLHDALIKHIYFDPRIYQIQSERLNLVMLVYEKGADGNVHRVLLEIEITEIETLILRKVPDYSITLIFSLDIRFTDDLIFLSFFRDIDFFQNAENAKRSEQKGPDLYIVAKKFSWLVRPFEEV